MKFLKLFKQLILSVGITSLLYGDYHLVQTTNIGYPINQLPVPLSDCLIPQIPQGRTTQLYLGVCAENAIAVNPKNPCHIVAAFLQSSWTPGPLEVGIAYTFDGGKTWEKTEVPFQVCSGGVTQRSPDEWLSFSCDGKRLFLSALGVNQNFVPLVAAQHSVLATVSEDGGRTWAQPSHIASTSLVNGDPNTYGFPFNDKIANASDRNHVTNAYITWDRFPSLFSAHSDCVMSRTIDGGQTWEPFSLVYNPYPDLTASQMSNGIEENCQTINSIIVVMPKRCASKKSSNSRSYLNGDLLNFMLRIYATPNATESDYFNDGGPIAYTFSEYDIALVRSRDLGETWDTTATVVVPSSAYSAGNPFVSLIDPVIYSGGYVYDSNNVPVAGVGDRFRTGNTIPSYNVNPKNGYLYTVYQSPQFRSDYLPQIGITTSRDGGYTWSEAAMANRTPSNSINPQAFTPFVAITEDGHVGVLYTDVRNDDKSDLHQTKTDMWLAIYKEVDSPTGGSTGIGLDFVKEVRLTADSYIMQNGMLNRGQYFVNADYSMLATHRNTFYATYTVTLNGPFNPPFVWYNNPMTSTTVLVDDNLRQVPIVSIVAP
jgi:hypothetical protein